MTSLPKLVFSIILTLVLIQSGHAKISTENLIIEKSDNLNLKKSTEIEEGDFIEVTSARAVMVAVDENNKPTALNK